YIMTTASPGEARKAVCCRMDEDWTIAALLDDLAGRGEDLAIVSVKGDEVATVSASVLASEATVLANGLMRAGMMPGEAVGLLASNGADWGVSRLALGAAGALVVALDDLASDDELKDFVRESGCRRLLTSASHVASLQAIDASLELIVLSADAPAGTRS